MNENCKELQGVVRQAPIIVLEGGQVVPRTTDPPQYIEYYPVAPSQSKPEILPAIGKNSVKVVVAGGQVIGMGVIVGLEMTYSILLLIVELLRMLRRPKTQGGVKASSQAPRSAPRQNINIQVNVKIENQ